MIYVTGVKEYEAIEAGNVLAAAGHDVAVTDATMTSDEIYETVLRSDALLMLWAWDMDLVLAATELGMAIAMGKLVYVARYDDDRRSDSPFLEMDGVKVFGNAEEAIGALLADLESEHELDGDGRSEAGTTGGDAETGTGSGDGDPDPGDGR